MVTTKTPNLFDRIALEAKAGNFGLTPEPAKADVTRTAAVTQSAGVVYGPTMDELLASKKTVGTLDALWADIKNLWPFGSNAAEKPAAKPSSGILWKVAILAAVVGVVWYVAKKK